MNVKYVTKYPDLGAQEEDKKHCTSTVPRTEPNSGLRKTEEENKGDGMAYHVMTRGMLLV
jgi:hypothetical protein